MNLGVSQVEKTVLKANVLACIGGGCNLKGKHVFALAQNGDVLGVNLDITGSDFFVDSFLVALYNLAAEGYGAFLVDVFKQLVVVDNDLQNAVLVADVEEHYAAVVADVLDPARYADLLTDVFFSQFAAAYGAVLVSLYHQNCPFTDILPIPTDYITKLPINQYLNSEFRVEFGVWSCGRADRLHCKNVYCPTVFISAKL